MKMENKDKIKNPPLGVKIISVLHYLVTLVYFLFGLSSIIFPRRIATGIVVANKLDYSLVGTISTWIVILSIILIEGIAVLEFFIARGLWRGKRWTRVMSLIFSGINIIFFLFLLFYSEQKISGMGVDVIFIGVNMIIIAYLIFNKKVREFFRKEKV